MSSTEDIGIQKIKEKDTHTEIVIGDKSIMPGHMIKKSLRKYQKTVNKLSGTNIQINKPYPKQSLCLSKTV